MSTHASTDLSDQYLSIVEAARRMAVHPSTIRRWIDQGIVPAYRLGRRRLGVRPADLAKAVAPRANGLAAAHPPTDAGIGKRMTKEEQRRALKAMEELFQYADELAARHGGKIEPEGWVLINEARDQRTQELMG